MKILYVNYPLWKSIVQDNSYSIYEEDIEPNRARAWAGGKDFVYRTDVHTNEYSDYTSTFPIGRTTVSGEDEPLAYIVNFSSQAQPTYLSTYYASAQVVGPSGGGPSGTDKAMLSIMNPASSGKTIDIHAVEYYSLGATGTDVYIDVQLRRITDHSSGTSITPIKRDTTISGSVATVRSASIVTGGDTTDFIQQLVIQSNSPASGEDYRFRFGNEAGESPIVLAEGEGLVIHHVTSNGSTFCPGIIWTESKV